LYVGASSSGSSSSFTATPRLCSDQAHDVRDERQVLQAQEVELDEPDRLDVGERVLRDDRAVLVDPERQVLGQRLRRDHDAGGVLRAVPQQPFEAERQVEEPLLALARLADLDELRLHLERLREREVLALLRLGIELRDAVGLGEREVEHAPDVLDRLLPLERAERDDLRDAVEPYFSRT
jgi:hypothetical protein